MTEFDKEFQERIDGIADEINGMDADQMREYLDNALDVEYRCDREKKYRSVEVCVACGGPGIWVDTGSCKVVGRWGGSKAERFISREAAGLIDEYFESWFNY